MTRNLLHGSAPGSALACGNRPRRLLVPFLAGVLVVPLFGPAPASTQEVASSAGQSSMAAELEVRRRMMAHPEQPEIYLELAELQVSRGAEEEALATLVSSSNHFLGADEPKKAVLVLNKAVEMRPDDAELQFLLGKAHTQNRDFEAAEAPLRRSIELGSEDPSVLVYLGAILWESGRMAEAEPVYRQAIEATDRAFMPLSQLGRLLLWQGQFDDAAQLLQEAAQKNPEMWARSSILPRRCEARTRPKRPLLPIAAWSFSLPS